ncbi:hypothetical protein DXD92_00175 [Blautia sp. TM10-2]|jgi:hypothetical protein|uniref:DUF6353 family protein n=1 Tax=Blautia sp. TM10-2 TaxID=2292990 RepID=UPI000E4C909F|nr:DUF6353 family protein [Blautia sp. TM10-2]RHU19929.1 hypothetical protein DXD92_00175 [Blautia sp. TM10-2]DAO11806.1 MAG TPA: hypothetical protein [Caudoviricetes sp.]
MKKAEIMNTLTRKFYRVGFKFKKHSPEILVGAGVVGVVASAVMACKATTKLDDVLAETKDTVDKIHDVTEHPEKIPEGKEYTVEDSKKDLTIVYTQAGVKLVKLYGPAVVLGTVSIAAIIGGHHILRKRNIALAAAYTAVDKGFKEYRGRVLERFGEEVDRELRYNIKAKEIEKTVTDANGKETVVKETVDVADPNLTSDYARFFDDGCTGWTKDPEFNLMFLKDQQRYANDLFKSKGHLFLNEVYDMLGIPRTQAGQVVGWIYDEKNPIGDNFIDFGIYDIADERKRSFVNGYERTILLDFNVDGNILEMI